MSNISTDDIKPEPSREEWVVRFLNLPSVQQVDFLYRSYLEESIRNELEQQLFQKNQENDK